jgi:hypothetical protein
MTDKHKKRVRDVQDQTGWSYMQCKFLVEQLGYGQVTEEIDKVVEVKGDLGELYGRLGKLARDAQRARTVG